MNLFENLFEKSWLVTLSALLVSVQAQAAICKIGQTYNLTQDVTYKDQFGQPGFAASGTPVVLAQTISNPFFKDEITGAVIQVSKVEGQPQWDNTGRIIGCGVRQYLVQVQIAVDYFGNPIGCRLK